MKTLNMMLYIEPQKESIKPSRSYVFIRC